MSEIENEIRGYHHDVYIVKDLTDGRIGDVAQLLSLTAFLAAKATMIDQDVQGLVQEIGLKATKNILEVTRDEIVAKKNPKD